MGAKRSEKRMEVIARYMKGMGGLNGVALGKAWMYHWHDTHPNLWIPEGSNGRVIFTDKEIVAFGQHFKYADPSCFQKLGLLLGEKAVRRRRSKR